MCFSTKGYVHEGSPKFPDYGFVFMTDRYFDDREALIKWVRDAGMKYRMYFAILGSIRGTGLGHGRVRICCERSGSYRPMLSVRENAKRRTCTSTKKNNCPFELLGVEQVGGKWNVVVDVNKSKHNHELGLYEQGHTSSAKLSGDEFQRVIELRRSNMMPKQILKQLKIENPNNACTIKHIENALQKNKKQEMGELTTVQYFFKQLKDHGYYHWHRSDGESNALGDVLFAHPKSTDLLRLFPHVLLMDATYRTNVYDVPLLEVVGMSSTGQNFHVAFGFIKNEVHDSYLWALQKVKQLYGEDASPGVIVTDRELALTKAVDIVFPSSVHLLCKRHIAKDVENYVVKITRNKGMAKAFSIRWMKIVHSLTIDDYNAAVNRMAEKWSRNLPTVVEYVQSTWLNPYKEKFVYVWTKKILNFGAETTNR